MEPVSRSVCEELSNYIDELVTSGQKELDQSLVKKIKSTCKKSDSFVEHAFRIILTYLEKEHAQIRYSCLGIINELFQRSHAFRSLLLNDFQRFLELAAEIDPDEPLPPPKHVAKELRIKTLQVVQEWHKKFSDGYKKLKLAYNFLRNCKKIDFNNIDAQNEAQRRREEEEQQQQARISQEKIAKVVAEMEEFSTEIRCAVTQLENCVCILFPAPDDLFEVTDFSDPQPSCSKTFTATSFESKSSYDNNKKESQEMDKEKEIVREHGLGNVKYSISVNVSHTPYIEQNENTSAVIQNLRELLQQVRTKFIPMVSKWLQILGKEGSSVSEHLKKAIDLKNELKAIADKCSDLKIHTADNEMLQETDDDDEFEEVEMKEGFEPVIPAQRRKEYGLDTENKSINKSSNYPKSTPKDWNLRSEPDEVKDPTTRLANIFAHHQRVSRKDSNQPDICSSVCTGNEEKISENDTKKKLLAEAPRRPFDMDLYYWEEEKLEAPEVIKFDSLHQFWKPCEGETTEIRKQEEAASLRMRRIEFAGEFVPVKWSCRAPLPSGKLCPRQDRYKCPFHGPIVPRDEFGNPATKNNHDESKTSGKNPEPNIPDWQEPQYLEDLKAATGIDLQLPSTSKALKKSRSRKQCKKCSGLIDIKKEEDNSRKRLEKKVMNKSALKRVSQTLDSIDQKRFRDKYGNQWQYSFNT